MATIKQMAKRTMEIRYTVMFNQMDRYCHETYGVLVIDKMDNMDRTLGMLTKDSEMQRLLILISNEIDDDPFKKVCVLAHELGHLWDLEHNFYRDFDTLYQFATGPNAWNYEMQAWLFGIQFLKRVGFTQWHRLITDMIRPHMYKYMKPLDLDLMCTRIQEEIATGDYTSGVIHA